MHEFEIIRQYFNRSVKNPQHFPLGVGDDAALISIPKGYELATSIDSLVEGTHFLPETAAGDLGHKSLAVSLSDLAAMGAEPAAVLLALTLPKIDPPWLHNFSEAFYHLANRYQVELIGGNITKGPLAVSTVTYGFVQANKAIRRSGAQPGDDIWVSGCFGDAALALAVLKKHDPLPKELHDRFFRPEPRVDLGLALIDLAHSAIDVSDGLAADLSKILEASQVGAEILAEKVPVSKSLSSYCQQSQAVELALTGGEDYELCFTAASEFRSTIAGIANKLACRLQRIGTIHKQTGLKILDNAGRLIDLKTFGFEHF
ncbi:MAG: thiamine-phosphate kinase [Proteobacteria bacterium]|nr:thiamine-phosphate kinase [Pseudomonadota bacterium]